MEAGRAYREVLQLDPRHHPTVHKVGVLSYEVGKPKDAKDFIQQAILLDPENSEYLNDLAVVQISLNELEDAITNSKKAIELNPHNKDACQTLEEARRLQRGELIDIEDPSPAPNGTNGHKKNGHTPNADSSADQVPQAPIQPQPVVVDTPVDEPAQPLPEAQHHDPAHLAMPLVDSPFLEHALDQMDIDESAKRLVREFAANGYVIIDTEIPEVTLDAAASAIASSDESRMQDGWRTMGSIEQIATDRSITDALELLYGRQAIPFQTLNYENGTDQPDHADTIHFGSLPRQFHCCAWVALEDINADSGELHCYPGSHKLPAFASSDLTKPGDQTDAGTRFHTYVNFMQHLIECQNLRKTNLKLKKGQAIIRAANTIHGGSATQDPTKTRMCQITQYGFEGCLYYSPEMSNVSIGQVEPLLINDIRTQQPVQPTLNDAHVLNVGQWPPKFA